MAIEVDGPEHVFSDRDLIYAATARCACGEGLAYCPGATQAWDCAGLLTARALPAGIPGAQVHCDEMPFATSRIRPESDDLGTTRPGGRARPMIVIL